MRILETRILGFQDLRILRIIGLGLTGFI